MKIRVRKGDGRTAEAPLVVLPLAIGEEDGEAIRALARSRGGAALRRAIAAARFRGKEGQVATFPWGAPGHSICLIGLGDAQRLDVDAWRRAAGRARRPAEALGVRRVALIADSRATDIAHLTALVEGFRLAGYRFTKYLSGSEQAVAIDELTLVAQAPPPPAALAGSWAALDVTVRAVETARDLVNEPAGVKTPTHLATVAEEMGRAAGVTVETLKPAQIAAEGFNGLLAVARGSEQEPRFVRMRYRGNGARRRIVLVGKGVTFDSGGLSLKAPKAMETMKSDMAGGAAVMAAVAALGHLKPPIEVEGLIPLTENLPSGRAQRPGDVIRFKNGKSVEVLNTDAEGRLILADALSLAATTKPDAIIDVATLTGACIIALGPQVAGILGNRSALVERLISLGGETGERLWELPLVSEYRDDLKSPVADLKNVGSGNAGTITGALFLQEFVGDVPWAHLDIAGPAFTEKDLPYAPKGGTGFGVRTLLRYLLEE